MSFKSGALFSICQMCIAQRPKTIRGRKAFCTRIFGLVVVAKENRTAICFLSSIGSISISKVLILIGGSNMPSLGRSQDSSLTINTTIWKWKRKRGRYWKQAAADTQERNIAFPPHAKAANKSAAPTPAPACPGSPTPPPNHPALSGDGHRKLMISPCQPQI